MPAFRSGVVRAILAERPGLQKVTVDLGGEAPEPSYVLTQLIGDVASGDPVVVNTTAVDLGLGTGGWHFVHWNLARRDLDVAGPGHIMKLRYTSAQCDTGSAEEHHLELADVTDIAGLPVVVAGLHSQLAGAALAARLTRPGARIAYVMTDGAALPLALSDLVAALSERAIIDTTITCGHAFGGDHEAVTLASGLAIARHVAAADLAIVAMGPGIVGTGTALGHTGVEVGVALDVVTALGGHSIAALRASAGDDRDRHRGLSHHTVTALGVLARGRCEIAIPDGEPDLLAEVTDAGLAERHDLRQVATLDIVAAFADAGLEIRSMGRDAAADPILHRCAAAAGVYAARSLTNTPIAAPTAAPTARTPLDTAEVGPRGAGAA